MTKTKDKVAADTETGEGGEKVGEVRDGAPDPGSVQPVAEDTAVDPTDPESLVETKQNNEEQGAAVNIPTGTEEEMDENDNPTGRVKGKKLGAKYAKK